MNRMAAESIGEAVVALAPELVKFIQLLVRTPSLPNEETAVQQQIAARLRTLGMAVDEVPTDFAALRAHAAFNDDGFAPTGRLNIVGRWRGSGAARGRGSLILNGHVDVVAPGNLTQWSDPPWSGLLRDGRIFGRGSCDMKAGLAAGIFAVAALQRAGLQPAHDVLVQSVIGEESGGAGTLTTIVQGYRADAAIVLEPTGLQLCPVQSGALTFRLRVAGRAAHAALRSHGVSAIEKFALLLAALQRLEVERHAGFANPLYDEPRFAAPISIGTVRAGEWHSTVAEELIAEGRMGVFPGETPAQAREAIQAAVAHAAAADDWLRAHPPQVEWFEGQFESGATPIDHPLLKALQAAHQAALGAPAAMRAVTYGSDLRLFTNHARIPAVLYGPGDVTLAHAANESIAVDEVLRAAHVLALFIADWCGATRT